MNIFFYFSIPFSCQNLSSIHAFVLHTNRLKVDADYIPELGFSSQDFGSKYHNLYSTTPCLMRPFFRTPFSGRYRQVWLSREILKFIIVFKDSFKFFCISNKLLSPITFFVPRRFFKGDFVMVIGVVRLSRIGFRMITCEWKVRLKLGVIQIPPSVSTIILSGRTQSFVGFHS